VVWRVYDPPNSLQEARSADNSLYTNDLCRDRIVCFGTKISFLGTKKEFRGAKKEFRGAKKEFRGAKKEFRGAKIKLFVSNKTPA
jgi:hypothetical protein